MDWNDFQKASQEALQWSEQYLKEGYSGDVFPKVNPGDIRRQLPTEAPQEGTSLETLFQDFQKQLLPGIVHWNDPRFFGYFPCNNSPPAVFAEGLIATLGINAMSWVTSPAATELELTVMEWLGKLIGVPWTGVTQDTASSSTAIALLAAREQKANINHEGFYGKNPLTVYASQEAHSSVVKAVRIAGLGDRYLRSISSNADLSLNVTELKKAIETDLKEGHTPCAAIATVGTTSTAAIDDVKAIAQLCQKHQIWLHVDAAMAGNAAILPEMRWLLDGVLQADSLCFNPHKWLLTNFDCSAFYAKNPQAIKKAHTINPAYLQSRNDGEVENLRDWSLQLGRSFRSLKLWFVLRHYGVEQLQTILRSHIKMATWLAEQIEADPNWQLFHPPKLNTVCFALHTNEATQSALDKINASGKAYLTTTRIQEKLWIRAAFGQPHTDLERAKRLWKEISGATES